MTFQPRFDERSPAQIKNLRDFIAMLWGMPNSAFIMSDIDCGTACCIEGWRKRFMGGADYTGALAEQQFGISAKDWVMICTADGGALRMLDTLLSPALRKRAMIMVLEQQLNTRHHDWLAVVLDLTDVDTTLKVFPNAFTEGEAVRPLPGAIRSEPSPQAPVQRSMPARTVAREEAALSLETADA